MQITAANWLCLLTPSELLIYDRVNLPLLNNIIKNNIVFYAVEWVVFVPLILWRVALVVCTRKVRAVFRKTLQVQHSPPAD